MIHLSHSAALLLSWIAALITVLSIGALVSWPICKILSRSSTLDPPQ